MLTASRPAGGHRDAMTDATVDGVRPAEALASESTIHVTFARAASPASLVSVHRLPQLAYSPPLLSPSDPRFPFPISLVFGSTLCP